jgi:DNA polymerase III sliding clamp (beta) subunit (PCNA family)
MLVKRVDFLQVLESVAPGLASKELFAQSSCFVFSEGRVFTFNDEISCNRKSPLDIKGAVKASPLIDLLSKLPDDNLDIEPNEDGTELVVRVVGKKKKCGIRMEAEVLLPLSGIESPSEWVALSPEFSEAINLVFSCASSEESKFILTCVHIGGGSFVESTDTFQVARFFVPIDIEDCLVRANSISRVVGLDFTEVSVTRSWLHFRNPAGLVFSCRRYIEEYPDLSSFLHSEGLASVTLPANLDEIVGISEIFSASNSKGNRLKVELGPDRLVITGEGAYGWYKEHRQVKYDGPALKFLVAPRLLVELSKKSVECAVEPGRLFIDGGARFKYATCTDVVEEKK